jgi:sugar lactone lactonase YvrE
MAGNYIVRRRDLFRTSKSKSVSPADFSAILPVLILIVSCAGGSRLNGRPDSSPSGQILNLRAADVSGPELGNGISLLEPADLTVNSLGEIYITDKRSNGIIRLSRDFQVLSGEGGIGSGTGDLNRPAGIDYDAAMNIYIADSGNRRIQIYDRNLRPADSFGEYFDKDGSSRKFNLPVDVAVDYEGNIWVADNDRVLKLNPFKELEFELSYSSDVRLDIGKVAALSASKTGPVAICDMGNRKVFVVSSYGNLVSEFQAGPFTSIAWDKNSTIWTANLAGKMISAYDISGNSLFSFSDNNPSSRPAAVAIDEKGALIAADAGLRRIVRYEIIRTGKDTSQ